MLPTVYALWASPQPLLPRLVTHSEVSPKVLGGADLFLQGVIVPPHGLPPLLAGDLAQLAAAGHPAAFAVGVMEVSAADAAAGGMKGKGLKLLHHYPDALWALGDRRVPGPEFTPARVWPEGAGPAGGGGGGGCPAAPADGGAPGTPPSPAAAAAAGVAGMSLDGGAGAGAGAGAGEPPAPSPLTTTAAAPPPADWDTPAGQDALAEHCLLAALTTVADADLPLLTSDLYSKHMAPARPPGTVLDLKKSSFKQLSKLLRKHEKGGLLATKLVRKQDALAKIERSHPLYTAFAPTAAAAAAARAEAVAADGGGGGAASLTPKARPVSVEPAYKVPPSLRPLLATAKPTVDDLYSDKALRSCLKDYCKAGGLRASGDKHAAVDKLLVGALFTKGERDSVSEGDAIPLEELGDRVVARTTAHTRVTRHLPNGSTATTTRRGPLGKIRVTVEDRHAGRKHLTRVVGVEGFALDPDALANALQKALKTSSSVSKVPGKDATDKEVALQGDLLAEVVAYLECECGVGGDHVDASDTRKPRS